MTKKQGGSKQKSNRKKKSPVSSNIEMLKELFFMIITHKKYWLLPLFFILAFLSIFISLSGNASILPAIYALF